MLLEALACEHLCVVLQYASGVGSRCTKCTICGLDLISREDDALAKEVRKNVVNTDELKAPVKRVQDVSLLRHKLIIVVGNTDEVEKLVDPRVGFLEILGRDKYTRKPDQSNHVRTWLALEVLDAS